MTSITRNFPQFIKDVGISVVGQRCYVSIIENLNIEDIDCIKYSLSKAIGISIVLGGSIMKVPQLLLILRAQSAVGLSLAAYILETSSYAITFAYSWRNGFPFSTYGENLFLTIQNVLITFLIVLYSPPSSSRPFADPPNPTCRLITATLVVFAVGVALFVAPGGALAAAQLCTLPLSLFSKLPQIAQNYRARSTGQLSTFACCAARLFTTAQEVNDPLVAAGFALAFVLNLVVGVQMYAYWGKGVVVANYEMGSKARDEFPLGAKETTSYGREKVDIVVQPQSPTTHPATHQHQHSQSAAYGRKWARKVD
ncbi:mannose-P-dolichol utilization defect 1 protein [Russula earlei]|uniref:Mannose-P-dolichol utilization defect 1 protein n=1 Tax=Russula earlei TaxID=71964 RepID=A0ACC0TR36_9AGAM|nr:mannose-P-dolichol utilization defect 1 protein [Russula earlei]